MSRDDRPVYCTSGIEPRVERKTCRFEHGRDADHQDHITLAERKRNIPLSLTYLQTDRSGLGRFPYRPRRSHVCSYIMIQAAPRLLLCVLLSN